MLKTWFSYIQPFYIFHSREGSMWLLMIVIYWFLPLHLSQFPNVHWKFVSCAFDVDEFMYEVFTIFLYFTFNSPLKSAMRIFFESQNIQFLFKRIEKMFNFCVQIIEFSTVLLKSNRSIAQRTIMHINVHNDLCSKTIYKASMICEM